MCKNNEPNIRFKGFSGDWEQRKLSEAAEKICVGFVGTCEKYYTDSSGIPMYRTGNLNGLKLNQDDLKYVTKEFHEQNKKSQLKKGDILIARHGDSGKAVNYELEEEANCLNIVIIRPNLDKVNYHFLADCINSPAVSHHIKALSAGSTQSVINTSEIEKLDVVIPINIEEQNKIAGGINNLDNLITLHQRKCDSLKKVKKYMLQKMFPKQGDKVPEIRFAGFTGDWEQRKLGDMVTFSKGTGYSKSDLQGEGTPIILYGRLYTKYETVISDIDTFAEEKPNSVLSKGREVIVPASGETAEDISVASVVEKEGVLLGGDLNIITPPENLDSAFLALSISNGKPHNDMAKMAQGKSVVHLHNSDLAKIDLPYPSYKEQCKISSHFTKIDNLITLHQRKSDSLKEIKKFMLQNMFPK
jgi:type I restriction enzyme S subunit